MSKTNKIVKTPEEMATITHDNLAESRISNLPSLERNPLLATYLSDASTGTTSWVTGHSMLERTILAQGFDLSHYTHYPYPGDDTTAYSIGLVLRDNLARNCVENHMVCHHLLAYHDVHPSETVKGRIAYFQDDAKRRAGIRTPIKVRKYLQKFFKDFRSAEELEQIAKTIDELLTIPTDWEVRLYSDASLDGWADAYYHVVSCMSTQTKAYGVGEHETYRCYCTAAMTNGAESSGLSLVVLYQNGKPVARSITYTSSFGEKCYVKNYGDDRLVKWLHEHGYVHRQWLPCGTRLWTEAFDLHNGDYLSPYVDGDEYDTLATLEFVDGQPYWVMSYDGVDLQNSCGYSAYQQLCNCCGELISRGSEYRRTGVHGGEVTLCYSCEDANCYVVDDVRYIYVSKYAFADLIATNSQGYYTQAYLDDNDLVVTGGYDIIYLDHAEYCAYSGEYYSESDFTDLSDEPEFVHDTWAGYINDNNRVRTFLYRKDGTYIEGLDCCVHDAHVKEVLARLASLENEA